MLPRHQPTKKRSYGSSSSGSAFPVYNPTLHPQHAPSSHRRSPSPPPSASSTFSVQAYEVSLIRGRAEEGREMEMRRIEPGERPSTGGGSARGRLLRWEREGGGEGEQEVWADRFSFLHLLPALPQPAPRAQPPLPGSPTLSCGWSELPSDTEDTFFFSDDEAEDYERDKKRRRLEGLRGGRLAALGGPEVEEEEEEEEEVRDDELPPPQILATMRYTATSLLASPSPRVLEMRILANHGADPRFSFMRGRYKDVWNALLAGKTVTEEGVIVVEEEKKVGIAGLMGGYGSDSDSGSDSDEEKEDDAKDAETGKKEAAEEQAAAVEEPERDSILEETEEEKEKKRRRKEKALEWARKRKEGASTEPTPAAVEAVTSQPPPPETDP